MASILCTHPVSDTRQLCGHCAGVFCEVGCDGVQPVSNSWFGPVAGGAVGGKCSQGRTAQVGLLVKK